MPPKSTDSSKKPAKAKTPVLINGRSTEEMSKEQLQEHLAQFQKDLDRERVERNYFQVERDRVQAFRNLTENQLEDARAELKNLDVVMEEDEMHHLIEINVYTQKVKHVFCEHQNTICELKADTVASTEVMQTQQTQLEEEIHSKIMSMRIDMEERDNENLVMELEKKHKEEADAAKDSLEKMFAEVEAKYQRKRELLEQEVDNKRKTEICERQDHRNKYIATLRDLHKKALNSARELIKSTEQELGWKIALNKEIENETMKRKQREKDLKRMLQDNKHLTECLSNVQKETFQLEKRMKHYIPRQSNIEKVALTQLNNLKREHEVLEKKFIQIQQERNELVKSLTQSFQNLQQKTDAKNIQLDRQLSALTDRLQKTQIHGPSSQIIAVPSAQDVQATSENAMQHVHTDRSTCHRTFRTS